MMGRTHKNKKYEKPTLHNSSDSDHRMVVRCVCIQCRWIDTHPDRFGSDFIIVRNYSKSLGLIVFLIYTVHSISKATVFTVAHFFGGITRI